MRRWLWLSLPILLLDQGSKYWVRSFLFEEESVPLSPFLNLVLVYNEGAAFSFLSGAGGWQRWIFIILALVITVVLTHWLGRLGREELSTAVALTLILGGAWGNLADRVLYGKVTDFIDFYYGEWHWPAFNVADAAITLGVVLMLLSLFRSGSRPHREGTD